MTYLVTRPWLLGILLLALLLSLPWLIPRTLPLLSKIVRAALMLASFIWEYFKGSPWSFGATVWLPWAAICAWERSPRWEWMGFVGLTYLAELCERLDRIVARVESSENARELPETYVRSFGGTKV